MVCWYASFHRNLKVDTIPIVHVLMRRVMGEHPFGDLKIAKVGVTSLGLMRIGSVWENGLSSRQVIMDAVQFKLDFNDSGWRFKSIDELAKTIKLPSSPFVLGHRTQEVFLEFDTGGDGKLLLPSTEFFARCYGHSQYVNRVLATYPESRWGNMLYTDDKRGPNPDGSWPIQLGRYTRVDDAVFLAHLKYDDATKRAAKRIYADLETAFPRSEPAGPAYPRIGPWFKGSAELRVEGIRLGPKLFFGLRVTGMSEPRGPTVVQETAERDEGQAEHDPLEQTGFVRRSTEPMPATGPLLLTDEKLPQGGTQVVDIIDAPFEILGERRKRVVAKSKGEARRRGKFGVPFPVAEVSPGVPGSGSAKGVGHASTHRGLVGEGACLDVWEALLQVQRWLPDLLRDPRWADADATWHPPVDGRPQFIPLPIRNAARAREPKMNAANRSSWIFFDPGVKDRLRGVMIVSVSAPGKEIYLFEMERRRIDRVSVSGEKVTTEEAFSGLAIQRRTGDPLQLSDVIEVLDRIRDAKGIMGKAAKELGPTWMARDYERNKSRTPAVAKALTIVDALRQGGLEISESMQQIAVLAAKTAPFPAA
jgi:hypothetical protein